jgi:cell division protein FtsB
MIESIEFEYAQAQKRNDKRVMIEIGNIVFRVQA